MKRTRENRQLQSALAIAGEQPRSSGPSPDCDRLWSVNDVSGYLGVPVSTLHQWRYLGKGPAAFRVGKHLRYDPDVVRRWLVESCSGVA
jgi:hypothetical protein